MSVIIDGVELTSASYNGNELNSIFYNNVLVWQRVGSEWPRGVNWESSTWQDVYNLCKAKQEGQILNWPSDVKLGATKILMIEPVKTYVREYGKTFTDYFLMRESIIVELIGIDIDGPGVLTFQTKNAFPSKVSKKEYYPANHQYNKEGIVIEDHDYGRYYMTSLPRYCKELYTLCDARPYIKSLPKAVYYRDTYENEDVITYINYNIWLPSFYEVGFTDKRMLTTEGVTVPYPIFTTAASRDRGDGYHVRDLGQVGWEGDRTEGTLWYEYYGFAPCFAIG